MINEEKTENIKEPIEAVLGTVLQMIQYMQNVINIEAATILHKTGWCSEYIDECPICKQEEMEGEEE